MRDIFNTNSSDLINQVYNLFIQRNYGEMIYHSEVEKILGIKRDMTKYGIYVKKAKDKAVEKHRVLKSIPGVGWQVLKPQQVSGYTYRKYIKKALKMYDYSEFILEYVEEDKLGDTRKEEYEQVKELNNEMKKTSQQTIERSKYYSRIDYYESLGEENI